MSGLQSVIKKKGKRGGNPIKNNQKNLIKNPSGKKKKTSMPSPLKKKTGRKNISFWQNKPTPSKEKEPEQTI